MKTYLVGGAVRDKLLRLPVSERDWVVVGSSEDELLNLGFRPVGRDFPVFLHPQSNEEYALARTELKTGPGHRGFQCRSDPQVTLEEDLSRRDLTINAIAETQTGELIDPFGGESDIKTKTLRHVSPAFSEDPLRILRVARFRARFHHLDFSVHPETTELITAMVSNREHEELTAERVLLELNKALTTKTPAIFFRYLAEVGADLALWPEVTPRAIDRLASCPARDPETRFAVLLSHLHEEEIQQFCKRLKAPKQLQELSILVSTNIDAWSHLAELDPVARARLIEQADGLRKATRFTRFNLACEEITGLALAAEWQTVRDTMADVKAEDLNADATGPALGELLRQERIRRIGELA